MVDFLGNAPHLEAHAGHSARHGLHDGVGKVVRQRRQHEGVHRIVDVDDGLLVAHVAQRKGRQGQQSGHFFGMTAEDGDGRVLLPLGLSVGPQLHGVDEIVHALALVGHALRHEEDDFLALRQPHTVAGFGLVAAAEDMGVDRIGNRSDVLARQQRTLLGLRFQPTAAGDKEDVAALEHVAFLSPYACRQVAVSSSAWKQVAMLAR